MRQALEAHVETFIAHLEKERRLSPHTLSAYRRDLVALTDFCEGASLGVESVDSYAVRRFAAEIHRRGASPRSVARRLSAVRRFFAFLVRRQKFYGVKGHINGVSTTPKTPIINVSGIPSLR